MTAIERCDKASFCIIAEDKVVPHRFLTQYRSVIAFGRLRVLKSDAEKREAAEFLGEAYYPGHPEACDEEIKKHWPAFNMVELKIEHLTGKKGKDLV